ncbi:hypothetical protein HK098_007709, partial [Nowakowskiella sp. JEL0407]
MPDLLSPPDSQPPSPLSSPVPKNSPYHRPSLSLSAIAHNDQDSFSIHKKSSSAVDLNTFLNQQSSPLLQPNSPLLSSPGRRLSNSASALKQFILSAPPSPPRSTLNSPTIRSNSLSNITNLLTHHNSTSEKLNSQMEYKSSIKRQSVAFIDEVEAKARGLDVRISKSSENLIHQNIITTTEYFSPDSNFDSPQQTTPQTPKFHDAEDQTSLNSRPNSTLSTTSRPNSPMFSTSSRSNTPTSHNRQNAMIYTNANIVQFFTGDEEESDTEEFLSLKRRLNSPPLDTVTPYEDPDEIASLKPPTDGTGQDDLLLYNANDKRGMPREIKRKKSSRVILNVRFSEKNDEFSVDEWRNRWITLRYERAMKKLEKGNSSNTNNINSNVFPGFKDNGSSNSTGTLTNVTKKESSKLNLKNVRSFENVDYSKLSLRKSISLGDMNNDRDDLSTVSDEPVQRRESWTPGKNPKKYKSGDTGSTSSGSTGLWSRAKHLIKKKKTLKRQNSLDSISSLDPTAVNADLFVTEEKNSFVAGSVTWPRNK